MALLPEKPRHGLRAMEAGAASVVGVRLRGQGPQGWALECHPALLQRVPGQSRWGDFAYRPVLARQGRRLTREHRLPLALAGRLLAPFQAAAVPEALAVAGVGRRLETERLPLSHGLQSQLDEALRKLAQDLQWDASPPLAADRRKCTLCSWRGVCNREAAEQGHLSEVSGIGAKRREMLQELGFAGLADLAAADPKQLAARLERFGEQHGAMAEPLVAQARAQRDGRVQRLDPRPALPELIHAPGVLLYDIESDPDARDDFLHGFLRLPRDPAGGWALEQASYHPLLTLQEQGERPCWRRLERLLDRYGDWPVLHYGETESLALRRMAQRQGVGESGQAAIRARLVDVHERVRRHWRLPLNSYGLKTVAAWRGFRWRQPGVDGARALLWWRQWRGSGRQDRGHVQALRWIFAYNHDDNLATWAVAQWLSEQDSLLTQGDSARSRNPVGGEI